MSDPVIIALIAAGPGIVASILAFLTKRRVDLAVEHLAAAKLAIVTLELNTNSIKDALVKVTGEAEFARGLKAGKEAAD